MGDHSVAARTSVFWAVARKSFAIGKNSSLERIVVVVQSHGRRFRCALGTLWQRQQRCKPSVCLLGRGEEKFRHWQEFIPGARRRHRCAESWAAFPSVSLPLLL